MIETDENINFLKGQTQIINNELILNENIKIESDDNIKFEEKEEKKLSEKKIKNMPKKQKIIFDIINLSKLMNKDYNEKELKKLKINELEKILGSLANNAMTGVEEKKIINVNQSMPAETCVNALYNMNFLLVRTIEDISNKLKSPVQLNGLTAEFDKNETDLKNCLSGIISDCDYGETIKGMLSPITLYTFCMLNIVAKTATLNMIESKNGYGDSSLKELSQSQ